MLDQLLTDSRLYTQSKDYKELLDFVVRLRNFAPCFYRYRSPGCDMLHRRTTGLNALAGSPGKALARS